MNRDRITSFSKAPTVSIERSRQPLKKRVWTTFNQGEIVPIWQYVDVLPGDTFNLSYSMVVRQTTALKPTMDDAFIDLFIFAIPWRILWENFKQAMGENKNGAWTQTTEYLVPMFTTPAGGMAKGTIAEKIGVRINTPNITFSQMPVRAYIMTYNEWFRPQALIAPLTEYTDDTDRTADNNVSELGGPLLKAARYADYFSTCNPEPQKGAPVSLPIGTTAPVLVAPEHTYNNIGTGNILSFTAPSSSTPRVIGINNGTQGTSGQNLRVYGGPAVSSDVGGAWPDNLYTDLSQAVAATINAQRDAFAYQRILEKDARGGTRYREIVKQHFSVTSPDSRQQVPEYLHGKHIPLNLTQVAQTSQGTSASPQANLAAFGQTAGAHKGFTKSFTEHTVLLMLGVVRVKHSYSQGLERGLSRRRRLDFYWPSLAFLGEQAVLNKEIFCSGNATTDNEVFGYQERWAEYRYLNDTVTGAFRPDYAQSLDVWLYTDDYSNTPVLSQEWIEETPELIDRTIAVSSSVEDQFIANFQISIDASRPLPLYSIPGLIDHY